MQRLVNKDELCNKIKELSEEFEIIAPKQYHQKGIFYQSISNPKYLYWGEGFTIEPVKRFFLEPSEHLFHCHFQERKNIVEEMPLPNKKRILFGVRPCEARGLTLLDKVFNPSTGSGLTLSEVERVNSDYKDSSYINNRERSMIIGLACASPDASCFCTSMGGSPVESRGMDALLFDMEDSVVIELCTDRAKEIFRAFGQELDEEKKKSLETYKQKRKDLITKKCKTPDDLMPVFENDYWQKVSLSCLSCGICTYLCPTCHCFDLVDEQRRKLRCYDGCAFSDFTMEASGVNPRPTKKERYRQRVFHKFDYFKKNFGENLCVGCGRCIRHCPVKIDIADIVDKAPV